MRFIQIPEPFDTETGTVCHHCGRSDIEPKTVTIRFDNLVMQVLDDPQWGKTAKKLRMCVKVDKALSKCKGEDGFLVPGLVIELEDEWAETLAGFAETPTMPYNPKIVRHAEHMVDLLCNPLKEDPRKKKADKDDKDENAEEATAEESDTTAED